MYKGKISTIIMTIGLTLSVYFINAQTQCLEVPAINGLSQYGDSIGLGGSIEKETFLRVSSDIFGIISVDTIGLFLIKDGSEYGAFLGNPTEPSGFNAYKHVVNIVNNTEMNIQSNYLTVKDSNQVHYVVYEPGIINFGNSVEIFLNTPSYSSNADAVVAGLPYGCLYFNTYTNSYSKVN